MAPFLALHEIAISSIIYITLWTLIHTHVKHNGLIKHANKALHLHSCLQVAVSVSLLFLTLLSLTPTNNFPTIHADDAFLPRYSLHCSRIFEYVDMLLFAAAGNVPDLHFAFHHLTTPYLTYFRLIRDYEGWWVFCGLNGFHHVLMHLFFAGVGRVQPVLPWTRYIQLIVGIACDVWIMTEKMGKGEACGGYVVSAVLLSCYLVLLTREVRARRRKVKSN